MTSSLIAKLRKLPGKVPHLLTGRRSFLFWQSLGIHVSPNHYYHPIPDTRTLPDSLWERPSQLVGIDRDEAGQLALLARFRSEYRGEYDAFPRQATSVPWQFYLQNHSYRSVDAEVLYCMVRHFRPRRILEIGSGFSTYLSAQAALRNAEEDPRHACEVVAVEPYPNEVLAGGFPGLTRLIPQRVQDLPLSEFEALGENDILFIDSSHVLKTGGDVQYEYLEVLPRLRPGVLVHLHDIFLPYEYPREWILDHHWFWTEQYLLQALLTHSSAYRVLWMGYYLHRTRPEELEASFSSYNRASVTPGSFWIRRTA